MIAASVLVASSPRKRGSSVVWSEDTGLPLSRQRHLTLHSQRRSRQKAGRLRPKGQKLTNMRASGSDENILLEPPRAVTLELALQYIEDDELIEVTPSAVRLRKRALTVHEREKLRRAVKKAAAE